MNAFKIPVIIYKGCLTELVSLYPVVTAVYHCVVPSAL